MAKSKFIPVFLEFVKELPNLSTIFKRESLMLKDLRAGGNDPRKIYLGFKNLERQGFIRQKGTGYIITLKGQEWTDAKLFGYFKNKSKIWDKKWRIIIFDIPQDLHAKRTRLRRKLQSMGCYMLQKSVFVFPYDCIGELGIISADLNISDYVDILIADTVGFHEKEIRSHFRL